MKYPISIFAIFASLMMASAPLCAQAKIETLTFSKPAKDSIVNEPVEFIHLGFDAPVDLVTLEIINPDGTVMMVYDAINEPFQLGTYARFSINVPEPLIKNGEYLAKWNISKTLSNKKKKKNYGEVKFKIILPDTDVVKEAETQN
ncbi:hypothetical protein LPB140_06935 [Sphingorhabdus lutea]|uniref:CopC domain-containing protein n=1 Tax=Sphingorhabdus lutea TaxID=1913578 RepID=A0A1L3JBX1_9SPHN|nr:copper resistance protein CopC [Sphingorhabdus lutea]APG62563.1 hypothetical protein LPB140_06935 [Sphingorhabdus lutea]